jgi:3-oxoacyl-[acyl-carrier-protein] synthase II
MTLAITGWSIVSSAGIGVRTVVATSAQPATADARRLFAQPLPLPAARAHTLGELDARKILGRRGTASFDRRTVLALIACRDALADAAIPVDDHTRTRIGVALGTTWGSLQAMSDYTKDSLLDERPYLVEPSRFPNTVMNCASGQAAIWFGLKGVNATIAGGPLAFLHAVSYTATLLRAAYADTMLVGAVEELSPHLAWSDHLTNAHADVPVGEAAGIFVVERPDVAAAAGRRVMAEILSVAVAFAPGGMAGDRMRPALEGCVRRALCGADVTPRDVVAAATCAAIDDPLEGATLDAVLGPNGSPRIGVRTYVGNCYAALGALQAGALVAGYQDGTIPEGRPSLLTGWNADGGVGAAVIRGWGHAGPDRR